jgi:hypothetical protein
VCRQCTPALHGAHAACGCGVTIGSLHVGRYDRGALRVVCMRARAFPALLFLSIDFSEA